MISLNNNKSLLKKNLNCFLEKYIVENTDNKRIAIYTVIIDNYDNLNEIKTINKNYDYYCFTNSIHLRSKSWKIIHKIYCGEQPTPKQSQKSDGNTQKLQNKHNQKSKQNNPSSHV